MWDDYGFPRSGRMPLVVYENGQIVFIQNQISFDASIGAVVGTISVINATPRYVFFVSSNPYFAISGNHLVVKGRLSGGVFFVNILAVRGFQRISHAVRIVVDGNYTPPSPPPSDGLVNTNGDILTNQDGNVLVDLS